jgi:hypothetical protein
MTPHNKGSWFKGNDKFARATGYGSKGFTIYGLPEFDWSLLWEWNKTDRLWEPASKAPAGRHLLLRVTLPSRTAKHVRAVAHTLWTPGSPLHPQEPTLRWYAFKKVDGIWQCAAIAGGKDLYD